MRLVYLPQKGIGKWFQWMEGRSIRGGNKGHRVACNGNRMWDSTIPAREIHMGLNCRCSGRITSAAISGYAPE
jgi:hypothetical protein